MGVLVDPTLEVVEVHGVATVDKRQWTFLRGTAHDPDIAVEAVVGRRLDKKLAALRTECPQGTNDGWMDTVGMHEQLAIDLQAVASVVPVNDRIDA